MCQGVFAGRSEPVLFGMGFAFGRAQRAGLYVSFCERSERPAYILGVFRGIYFRGFVELLVGRLLLGRLLLGGLAGAGKVACGAVSGDRSKFLGLKI